MSNFTFITENNTGNETIFAIDADKITELNLSDTYDGFGQKNGAADVGDYICLTADNAEKLNKWCTHHTDELEDEEGTIYAWVEGEIIESGDFRFDMFNEVVSDDSKEKQTCQGFTFWNGHNWKTITTELEHGEPTHIVIKDAELIEKLNTAIENREFEKEGFGTKTYRFEDVEMVNNFCQGSFSAYEITID